MKRSRRVLIVIFVIVAVILLLAGAAFMYVSSQYNKAYEKVDIVKREDTYVMPEYPTLDETPPDEGEDDSGFIEPDTVPEGAEPLPEVIEPEEDGTVTPPTVEEPVAQQPVQTSPKPSNKPTTPLSVYKKISIYEVEQKDPEVLNILLLGTDSTNLATDMGRSDSMVVVSYNAKDGTVRLTSLLRDSLVPIEGYGWNRINTAYFFGGVGLAINTVNQLYDLDIQKFMVIDMKSVRKFLKKIDGVDVKLTKAEVNYYNQNYGTEYVVGMNHLDHKMALVHMRNRSIDSDFGRTRRQRDVIMAVVNKILNGRSLSEINKLVKYGTEMIRTNVEMTEILSLASSVVENKDVLTIEAQSVPYTDSYRSTWYKRKAVLSFDIEDAARRINEFIYE